MNFQGTCSASVVDQIWGLITASFTDWNPAGGDSKHHSAQLELEGGILESSQDLEGHFPVCQHRWACMRGTVLAGGESQHPFLLAKRKFRRESWFVCDSPCAQGFGVAITFFLVLTSFSVRKGSYLTLILSGLFLPTCPGHVGLIAVKLLHPKVNR